jgi:hypothetical protein
MFSSARMMKPWIETQHIEGETPVSGFWHPKPTRSPLRTVTFFSFSWSHSWLDLESVLNFIHRASRLPFPGLEMYSHQSLHGKPTQQKQ